jgi:hypothetical protein
MAGMARRKLSTRGRVVAAGLCVGLTGVLAGVMAATDDTSSATAGTSSSNSNPATVPDRNTGGTGGYDTDGDGRVGDPGDSSGNGGFSGSGGFRDDGGFADGGSSSGPSGNTSQPSFPQPQTRSGGS